MSSKRRFSKPEKIKYTPPPWIILHPDYSDKVENSATYLANSLGLLLTECVTFYEGDGYPPNVKHIYPEKPILSPGQVFSKEWNDWILFQKPEYIEWLRNTPNIYDNLMTESPSFLGLDREKRYG